MSDPKPTLPSSDDESETVLFDGHPAVLATFGQWVLAIVTLGILALWFFVRARSVRYRITSQRVIVETGLLGKRLDQIDLYRIHDYVVERPLGQRIAGTGNLVLQTVDRSTPSIRLAGLAVDVVALYEKLRRATEAEKRRRGVRVLDADRIA